MNVYDGSGRVISPTDGMGNRWTYAYDSNSLVTTITGS
jgi:YD repeat-containing protein